MNRFVSDKSLKMFNTKKYFAFASVFSIPQVSGNGLHKHKKKLRKVKCMILCFLQELNINQDFSQDVKNVNRQDVPITRIQISGRYFTLLMVKRTWSN